MTFLRSKLTGAIARLAQHLAFGLQLAERAGVALKTINRFEAVNGTSVGPH